MKKFLIFLVVILVLIQLYRPKKNTSELISQNHISKVMTLPADVEKILERSCYDCHSNNTKYTWYHEIAPMSWGVSYHISEGKQHLNFDEFATYNAKKQTHAIEETAEVVAKGEMPMKGYVIFHPETAMSQEEIQIIKNWAIQNGNEN